MTGVVTLLVFDSFIGSTVDSSDNQIGKLEFSCWFYLREENEHTINSCQLCSRFPFKPFQNMDLFSTG